MRILFSMRQPTAVRNFESTLRGLAERGHEVHVAFERQKENVQNQSAVIDRLVARYPSITQGVSPVPADEQDSYYALASKLRYSADYLRYLEPRYADAHKLRKRAQERVAPDIPRITEWPLVRTQPGIRAFGRLLREIDQALPLSPEFEAYLREQAPDVVLVTPMLHVGPQGQVELVRAARALGIATGLCVHSWDNLTNKGLIHEVPDMVAVWNQAQAREAIELHGVPAERVSVTGAPAMDQWFDAAPSMDREAFCEHVGLPPDRPFLTYLCSSTFVAPREFEFVLPWIEQLRGSGHPELADAGILIRPYPVGSEPWLEAGLERFENVVAYPPAGADPVDTETRNAFFDSIHHSSAVVGINTTALIESAAIGRDTYTLRAETFRDTQDGTLHFKYLLRENGGPLHVAETMEEHADALARALREGDRRDEQLRRFVEDFVRPAGLDVSATDRLVEAIETLPQRAPRAGRSLSAGLREKVAAAAIRLIHMRYATLEEQPKHAMYGRRGGATGYRVFFPMAYPGYLRYYDTVVEGLAANGHEVFLAFEAPKKQAEGMKALEGSSERIADFGRLKMRRDTWMPVVRNLRRVTDYIRYLDPRFADAHYLRDRTAGHLPRGMGWLAKVDTLPAPVVRRALRAMLGVEHAIPSSRYLDDHIKALKPDVIVLTPLLTDASRQTDIVKSARKLGIPTVMGVASWDHLTTKGMIRHIPDRVLLWNELLREEAITLHEVPDERITVTGAQPFDRWFERRPARDAATFRRRVGLKTGAPFVLFVGSTASISHPEFELNFVRRWIEAIRASEDPALRDLAVLVRPHPYNPGLWTDADLSDLGDVAIWPRGGANPVDPENRNDYFDSMYHSAAVVGINTSAFVEASIVGCSVLTVRPPEFADTQDGTLHFHYLRPENGGPLMVSDSLDEHVGQLASVLADPEVARERVRRFVANFVRPLGMDTPGTPVVVEAIEREAARGLQPSVTPSPASWPVAAGAWAFGIGLALISAQDRGILARILLKRYPVLGYVSGARRAAMARLRGARPIGETHTTASSNGAVVERETVDDAKVA